MKFKTPKLLMVGLLALIMSITPLTVFANDEIPLNRMGSGHPLFGMTVNRVDPGQVLSSAGSHHINIYPETFQRGSLQITYRFTGGNARIGLATSEFTGLTRRVYTTVPSSATFRTVHLSTARMAADRRHFGFITNLDNSRTITNGNLWFYCLR